MDEERTITIVDRRTGMPIGKVVRCLEVTGNEETLRFKARPGWRSLTLEGLDCGYYRTRREAIAAIGTPLPPRPTAGAADYLAEFAA